MADLASSAVSLYPTELGAAEFFPNGKGDRTIITRRLKVVLAAQGDATDKITASALGFSKLISCSELTSASGGAILRATVEPIANIIVVGLYDSDATQVATGTFYITVTGTPKVLAA
jgi:hypothetical protein